MIFHYLDLIVIDFIAMATIAICLLAFIARKVNHMSTATDALTAALAELQTSFAALETHLAAPPPVAPSVDEEAIARAAATVTALKTQVDGLVTGLSATPAVTS